MDPLKPGRYGLCPTQKAHSIIIPVYGFIYSFAGMIQNSQVHYYSYIQLHLLIYRYDTKSSVSKICACYLEKIKCYR